MPLARYFFYVGGVLLALLLIADAYLPKLPVAHRTDEVLTTSAFIPIGNGRSALFTTPGYRPSPLRRARIRSKAQRPRQQSPLPSRGSRGHLRNCHRLMQTSCNHPIQKSANRSCNANEKLRRDTHRRLCSWSRGNRDLAGLAIGEQRLSPAHLAPNVCADCQPKYIR
jgi:hypothetical protein